MDFDSWFLILDTNIQWHQIFWDNQGEILSLEWPSNWKPLPWFLNSLIIELSLCCCQNKFCSRCFIIVRTLIQSYTELYTYTKLYRVQNFFNAVYLHEFKVSNGFTNPIISNTLNHVLSYWIHIMAVWNFPFGDS